MKSKTYSLKMTENLIELIETRAREKSIDSITALRQLVHAGAEDYVLELIGQGKLSVSKGAELLNMSLYEIYRRASERNIEIGSTLEQYEKGKKTAERIL